MNNSEFKPHIPNYIWMALDNDILWLSMDAWGQWWGHVAEPTQQDNFVWQSIGAYPLTKLKLPKIDKKNWRFSLVKRPQQLQ